MQIKLQISDSFWEALQSSNRWLVMYGGAGSGKSVAAAQKIIKRCIEEPGHFFLVTRKVAVTCKHSTWKLLLHIIQSTNQGHLWQFNETLMKATYTPNGSMFMCVGMDDREKIKSIAGVTGFWHEEATELMESDINQLDLRLRGYTSYYKQHIVTFNPVSVQSWIKKFFWDNRPDDCYIHHSTYHSNPFLDKSYKDLLEGFETRDYNYYKVYTLGEWGSLQGLIYSPWDSIPLSSYPPEERWDDMVYGLDFGFNNPTALVQVIYYDGAVYLKEILYGSHYTTDDIVQLYEEAGCSKKDFVYCDSAEPDRIEELYRKGLNAMPADKGPGSVAAGINTIKLMKVFTCPENVHINEEVAAYKWKEDRNGILFDEPAKFSDHAMDAIRYAIHSHGAGGFQIGSWQ